MRFIKETEERIQQSEHLGDGIMRRELVNFGIERSGLTLRFFRTATRENEQEEIGELIRDVCQWLARLKGGRAEIRDKYVASHKKRR